MRPEFTTRKALKAHLSLTVPQGEESKCLEDACQELAAAQAEVNALKKQRTALSRQISVRERILADWKGKIPRGNIQPPTSALRRAGNMPWTCIADMRRSRLQFREPYKSGIERMTGFSHIWVVTVRGDDVCVDACEIREVDEKAGRVVVSDDHDIDGIIVDVKPYLGYCDVWDGCNRIEENSNRTKTG